MPEYQIRITRTAQKQLDKLPDSIAGMLSETILELAVNPRPHGCKKLKGRDGYRIRKGDFRIIYDIFDQILIVEVIAVGNRKTFMNNKTITVLNLIGLSAGGSPQLSKEMIQAALASAAQSLKGETIYRIAV